MSLRVHHLNCAHLTGMSLDGEHLACHVLLIETPSSGLVLVDTGLGSSDYAAISSRLGVGFAYGYGRPVIDPSLAAVAQVRDLGFQPDDVRHIVQTHLDLDHVGGLSDFPWATVQVHGDELVAAMSRKGVKAHGRYHPRMWAHGPRFQAYSVEGEAWFGFQAVRQLRGLPEEVLLIPLVGHTLGHCGVAVHSEDGWLLDAGDAYFNPSTIYGPSAGHARKLRLFETIVTTNRNQRRHNQARLRQLVADHPEVRVFNAHDPGGFPH